MNYYVPKGGLSLQKDPKNSRAVFTTAYAFLPAGVLTDIVTSPLPHWTRTRSWVIARPLSGFAETFSHYITEVEPGGGSQIPEPNPEVEAVIFVVGGEVVLTIGSEAQSLTAGGYAYLPAGTDWSLSNASGVNATFHWIRKRYEAVDGFEAPDAFITHDEKVAPIAMPGTNGAWATTRFVDPEDLRHDMHVNIVTFQPGGYIPFPETHVMEHGLYVLQGRGDYLLNQDTVPVGPGDYMWLRAFCPQACTAGGSEPFRYLLYKDVNRHARFGIGSL